jgi:hypothetical protein
MLVKPDSAMACLSKNEGTPTSHYRWLYKFFYVDLYKNQVVMKKECLFIMLLVILAGKAGAQNKSLSKAHAIKLNGKVIAQEALDYINVDNIQAFKIEKDTACITLKKELNYNFLSMLEISGKYVKGKAENPLFFVNGKLVTDTNFLLAEQNLKDVSVASSETLPYQNGRKFDIINIRTHAQAQYFVRGETL